MKKQNNRLLEIFAAIILLLAFIAAIYLRVTGVGIFKKSYQIEVVKYTFASNKPYLIYLNDIPFPVYEVNETFEKAYFAIGDRVRVYCFNNSKGEVVGSDGKVKRDIQPSYVITANYTGIEKFFEDGGGIGTNTFNILC